MGDREPDRSPDRSDGGSTRDGRQRGRRVRVGLLADPGAPTDLAASPRLVRNIALINTVGTLGGFAAGYVTGWLRDPSGGYATPFPVMAPSLGISVALATALLRHDRNAEAPARRSAPVAREEE